MASTNTASIKAWMNTCIEEAIGESRWLKQVRDFGPTVVGTSDYRVDDDVIDVRLLRVNNSLPWSRGQLEDAWTLEASPIAALTGNQPGMFSPSWEIESAQDVVDVPHFIRLTPAPSVAGYSIQAQCSVMHTDVTTSAGSYALQLPGDLVRKIAVDGPIGLGALLVHQRSDLAAPYLARFEDGKKKLAGRTNTQIGSGTRYARVWRGGGR